MEEWNMAKKKSPLNLQEVAGWTEAQALQFGRDHAADKIEDLDHEEQLDLTDFPAGHANLFYAYDMGFKNPLPKSGAGTTAFPAEGLTHLKTIADNSAATLKAVQDTAKAAQSAADSAHAAAEAAKAAAASVKK
jgi:hypothetical protein